MSFNYTFHLFINYFTQQKSRVPFWPMEASIFKAKKVRRSSLIFVSHEILSLSQAQLCKPHSILNKLTVGF